MSSQLRKEETMRPLSTLKFVKSSLGKVLPLAITLSLSVMLLYFFLMMTDQLVNNDQTLDVNPFLNMSIISGTGDTISEEQKALDYNKLLENQWIAYHSFANIQSIDFKTPSKMHTMLLVMIPSNNIETIMKWQKVTLSEGTLPKMPDEILLHEKLAKSYHLKVGDLIPPTLDGWHIKRNLKVTGIASGPAVINLGIEKEEILMSGNLCVITLAKDNFVTAMNQELEKCFGNRYELMTLQRGQEELNESRKSILLIMTFIGILIILALSVLLGNISMIQYSQRTKEFEILFAIGYTKKQIAWKVLREIFSSNLLGYFIGLILGIIIGWLTNIYLFIDPNDYMKLWNIENILLTLLIPIMVTFTGFIAPMKLLRNGNRQF